MGYACLHRQAAEEPSGSTTGSYREEINLRHPNQQCAPHFVDYMRDCFRSPTVLFTQPTAAGALALVTCHVTHPIGSSVSVRYNPRDAGKIL